MKISNFILRIAAVIAIAAAVCVSFASCGEEPPEMEDVYGRIVELIERSNRVNSYLFGEGLPVYKYGSDYADALGTYSDSYGSKVYDEKVSYHAMYVSLDQMKQEAREVYSEAYLESVFESVFTGIMNGEDVLYARYSEDFKDIYQNSQTEALPISRRVYDYSSMKIVMPSDSERIKVKLDSYVPDDPENRVSFTLTFVFENGNWFLDSPTY